jgi:hypothetical protein
VIFLLSLQRSSVAGLLHRERSATRDIGHEEVTMSEATSSSPRRRGAPAAAGFSAAGAVSLLVGWWLGDVQVYFVVAALILAVAAVVSAWRAFSDSSRKNRGTRVTAAVMAVAVAAVGLSGAHWTTTSTKFEAAAHSDGAVRGAVQTVNASAEEPEIFESDEVTTDSRLKAVVETAASIQPVSDSAAENRIALAQQIGYRPVSGLELD